MTHPFFEVLRFPWHRAEAITAHQALYRGVTDLRQIELAYKKAGGTAPLNPNQPPDLAWKEVIDRLTAAGYLKALCQHLLADHRLGSVHPEVRALMDASEGDLPTGVDGKSPEQERFPDLLAYLFQAYDAEWVIEQSGGQPEQIPLVYNRTPVAGFTLWYSIAKYFVKDGPDSFKKFVGVVMEKYPKRREDIDRAARTFIQNQVQSLRFPFRVNYGNDATIWIPILEFAPNGVQEAQVPLAASEEVAERDIALGSTKFAREWKRIHRIAQDLYILFSVFHGELTAIVATVGYRDSNRLDAELEVAQRRLRQVVKSEECARLGELTTLHPDVSQVPLVASLAEFQKYLDFLIRALGVPPTTAGLQRAYGISSKLSAALLNSLRMADQVLERHLGPPGCCWVEGR